MLISILLKDAGGTGPSKNGVRKETQIPVISYFGPGLQTRQNKSKSGIQPEQLTDQNLNSPSWCSIITPEVLEPKPKT